MLLLGIGGFALPLIAPLIGVLIMLSMPRWTHLQVRVTSLIAGVGVLATVALVALAVGGSTSATAIRWSLLLISIVVLVGPGAALHTATRRQ